MIRIENVSFAYPQKKIFDRLSFEISAGEFLWIKGRNGTGKTTLLRMLMDLITPSGGVISFERKLQIGWVPASDASFFPRLTGQENLEFFEVLSNRKLNIPSDLRGDFCDEVLSTPFQKMSTGMKQYLLLLRASLKDPELYLLDEPLRGLDQQNRTLLLEHLSRLSEKGKTIIMTGHQEFTPGLQVRTLELRSHALA